MVVKRYVNKRDSTEVRRESMWLYLVKLSLKNNKVYHNHIPYQCKNVHKNVFLSFIGFLQCYHVSAALRYLSINSVKRKDVPDRNVLPKGICWTMPSMPGWVLKIAGKRPNVGWKKGSRTKREEKERFLQGGTCLMLLGFLVCSAQHCIKPLPRATAWYWIQRTWEMEWKINWKNRKGRKKKNWGHHDTGDKPWRYMIGW